MWKLFSVGAMLQGDVCEQASQRLLEVCTLALQPQFEGCLSSR